jgi:hypothetical protein
VLDRRQAGGLNGGMILAFISALGDPASYSLAAALLTGGLVWYLFSRKLSAQSATAAAELAQARIEAEAKQLEQQARAKAATAEMQGRLDGTVAKLADVEQRYATHREVSDRRANDASQQISLLESELSATREIAAQLPPTQARIKDMEVALAAEQGRMKAHEVATEAISARMADVEKRLSEAQEFGMKAKADVESQKAELSRIKAEQEALAASGGFEAELKKAKDVQQQAEAKIAQLQKSVSAAEARTAMVQKEFMNAVGVSSAPTPGTVVVAGSAATSDKRVRELEDKIAQVEAEARKKAREDGYKIAELEYRLSEAVEKK